EFDDSNVLLVWQALGDCCGFPDMTLRTRDIQGALWLEKPVTMMRTRAGCVLHAVAATNLRSSSDLWSMIAAFMTWSSGEQYLSQDYFDLWATKFGQWAKKTFHSIPLMGAPAVGPLLVLDLVWPGVRCFIAPKRVYPICLAHMGLGFLNIWEA